MAAQKQTKTALDPTFYSQKNEDGTFSTPPYPFNDIVATEMFISEVGMQDIVLEKESIRTLNIG
jgi:hypothetical protein